MKKMRVIHRKDGTVELDVDGFRGEGCREFSAPFEAALGLDATGRVEKHELYETDAPEQEATQ